MKRYIALGISAFTLFMPPVASAQTYPMTSKHIIVNQKALSSPPSIAAKDGSSVTTFMPIWYVGKALEAMGIKQNWNGSTHTWALTTSSAISSISNPGRGNTTITLNGKAIQKVNAIAYKDPSTGNNTVYMPIYYIINVLKLLNIAANWDGTNWRIGTGWDARSSPLAGVYHPSRLHVIDPLKTVSGTVEIVRHESDKDYHINLKLVSQYSGLINDKNAQYEHGDLVVEVIPMDQHDVPIPTVGEHITVTGAYVKDADHGWMEIHPAWLINGKGSPKYTTAAAAASVQTGLRGNGDEGTGLPSATSTSNSSSSGISLTSFTQNVSDGSEATITVTAAPGTTASIEVDYSSEASHASGLSPKKVGADGTVSWSWKVGSNTTAGNWPVIITDNGQTLKETLHVS